MRRPRLVVVGHGMAAASLLEHLSGLDARWDVVVFGDEPGPAYDRIALSAVVSGERAPGGLEIRDPGWYAERGIEVHTGVGVRSLDPAARRLRADRSEIGFDACVVATGSTPVVPAIPGTGLDGVRTLRTDGDARAIARRAGAGGRAVVLGGGLLGVETACGLLRRGMRVTLAHLGDRLLDRQLDEAAALLLRRELEWMGVRVLLGAAVERIEGRGRVESAVIGDGTRLPADLVVACVGVRPNTGLAAASGVRIGRRGVVVDEGLATSSPGVFALGECTEHRGRTFGTVGPVYDQARVLARRLAGDPAARFAVRPQAARLKVTGLDVYAGGRTLPSPGDDEVVLRDDGAGVYKKLVTRDGAVVGVALVGDLAAMSGAGHALAHGRVVDDGVALLGGIARPGSAAPPAAGLPLDAVVCGCNGVTKAAILTAIGDGHRTREQVARSTRAGTTCGQCGSAVDGLLAEAAA